MIYEFAQDEVLFVNKFNKIQFIHFYKFEGTIDVLE